MHTYLYFGFDALEKKINNNNRCLSCSCVIC